MCFSCYRTYVMILCNWLILWQNTLYLYLGRLRMCLTTSRNHVSRLSVETFKSVQEASKSANSLKLDSWSIPSWHLLSVEVYEFQISTMIFLGSVNLSMALTATLSDTEPKDESNENDDEGILNAFTATMDPRSEERCVGKEC